MTRPGWVPCPRCRGRGYGPPGAESIRCPDCAGGEIPGDELVNESALGPDGEDFNAARAALIAARRWEEQ